MTDEVPALTSHFRQKAGNLCFPRIWKGLLCKSPSVETCQIVMKAVGQE